METLLRTILVDDDPYNIVDLKDALNSYSSQIEVIAEFNSGTEAADFVNKQNPDLVFLDIEMPVLNGFEMLHRLQIPTPIVIFVTAHAGFALESFEHSPADFLIKPVDPMKLDRAMQNAFRDFHARKHQDRLTSQQKSSGHLPVKYKDRYGITRTPFIQENDILMVKTSAIDPHYIEIHTLDGSCYGPIKYSLSGFHKLINSSQFIYVYKNMLANKAHFLELIDNKHLILKGRTKLKIKVSRRYCRKIKESFAIK
jgi:two-component system, LytTR family, response regulator